VTPHEFRERLEHELTGAEKDAPPMPALSEIIRRGRWAQRRRRLAIGLLGALAAATLAALLLI